MKIMNILIGLDQWVNTWVGGYPDETISSRCWRLRDYQPYKTLRPLIDLIPRLRGNPNHCQRAYESELARTQEPQELR